jgi:hypothetical protein
MTAPAPGSPEFLRMIEHTKDEIEAATGVRPDVVDVGSDDDWRQELRRRAAREVPPSEA